jgi:hypothetical protein
MRYLCTMKYKEWQKRPVRFLSTTGYTIENFEALYPCFEDANNEYLRIYSITEKRRGQRMYVMYSRVLVEHVIGSVKRCRIVKNECRLRKNDFIKHVLYTCAALHNFRLKFNPFRSVMNSIQLT